MKRLRYYDVMLAAFAGLLLISNISATKLVAFGSIITDGGAILFPLIYIMGDVITEVYGYRYARRAIWTGFGLMLLAVATFWIVGFLPAAAEYTDQAAFDAVLGFFPRIVLASLLAYLVGSFLNAYIVARMKQSRWNKRLWYRLIGSTVVGELADTIIFGLVAFGGILGAKDMVVFILIGWLFKTTVEIIVLPVTYRAIALLNKREHIDANDKKTDFSPFHFSAEP